MTTSEKSESAPYQGGRWTSPIDPEMALARPGSAQWPERHGDSLFWVQSLPEQAGRLALMRCPCDQPDQIQTVTPADFNLRTRVHEYGGRCHIIVDDSVYFVNFTDQGLYRQSLVTDSEPQPVTTPATDGWMLADPLLIDGNWLVFVGEQSQADQENTNALVAVHRRASPGDGVQVLAHGDDFYACPVLSPDKKVLAYFSWRHPDMPWDSSRLSVVDLSIEDQTIAAGEPRHVAGGEGQAVCQLLFSQSGDLIFALDRDEPTADRERSAKAEQLGIENFWNLYRMQLNAAAPVATLLTQDHAEYGAAHWVFGYRRLVDCGQTIVAVRTTLNGDELVMLHGGEITEIDSDAVRFSFLSQSGNASVLAVAEFADRDSCIVELDIEAATVTRIHASDPPVDREMISEPRQIRVPTRDGAATFAWFYRPANPAFTLPEATRPPLMVLVHGGPTSRAEPSFDLSRQYWTSRGFAVVDVNHRGSTGFGRQYRQALRGQWGEIDVDDVADVVAHLVESGEVNADLVFIRGSSAGGYVVLRALTRHPLRFSAGACYYGIGNLVTLAQSTHKFESRYLDGLLGESFDAIRAAESDNVYHQRSPINYIENLASPMILFQGSEDQVVPPEVTREVVEALTARKLHHEYVEYEGEGHGFRKAENRIDALSQETRFFDQLLG